MVKLFLKRIYFNKYYIARIYNPCSQSKSHFQNAKFFLSLRARITNPRYLTRNKEYNLIIISKNHPKPQHPKFPIIFPNLVSTTKTSWKPF